MARIGFYGGSFNPPHIGHALAAWYAKTFHSLDEVLLVPTFEHPYGKELAPFSDRLGWVQGLAETLGPWASASALEAELGGCSYTLRSLRALAESCPQDQVLLLGGTDVVQDLARWEGGPEILAEFQVAPVPRALELSSTRIRQAVSQGDWDFVGQFVPPSICQDLRARKFFRTA